MLTQNIIHQILLKGRRFGMFEFLQHLMSTPPLIGLGFILLKTEHHHELAQLVLHILENRDQFLDTLRGQVLK